MKYLSHKDQEYCSADGPAAPASPQKRVLDHALPEQPPAFLLCHGLQLLPRRTLAGLDMTVTARDVCLAVERRLEQGQWRLWLKLPAGRPGHCVGL